jgi:ketosteroid isomerase-like protein
MRRRGGHDLCGLSRVVVECGSVMVDEQWAWACIRDVMTAWNRRDWSAFESLHACDVLYESPHHPCIVGRSAVVRRYQDLVAVVPDLRSSGLRMIENDRADQRATFEYIQTGTLSDPVEPSNELRGPGSPFTVHTTMFVRFDDDGRVAALRTVHN